MQLRASLVLTPLLLILGCTSEGQVQGGGKVAGAGNGGSSAGNGSGGAGGITSQGGGGGNGGSAGTVVAAGGCPAESGLSSITPLANVQVAVQNDTARITFDPLADARDYRVYALPSAGDVSGNVIQNATYRCAGNHQLPVPAFEDEDFVQSGAVRTRIKSSVQGFVRSEADTTLGYVFTTPGDGRLPVYVLGDSDPSSDNTNCYFMRWQEGRVKHYTTSEAERTTLLGERFRDDGIAFYVAAPGSSGTAPVYRSVDSTDNAWEGPTYMLAGAEHTARTGNANKQVSEAFSVWTTAQPGSEPLMRVYYDQVCARGHDELVAGVARFNKAYLQGMQPVTELHFSGLAADTTLVVEALDGLCPHQGLISPRSRPASTVMNGDFVTSYPAFLTPDEIRASSAGGELFIGGMGDGPAPTAIARTCIDVPAATPAAADWRYDVPSETFSAEEQTGFQIWELDSPSFDVQMHTVETDKWAIGNLFDELWITYADWAADTNGKVRITPKTKATLAADTYLHATMSVDTVTSDRRYPQLLISDRDAPVQVNMEQGVTIVVQSRGGITGPVDGQIQFCDHRYWDVNNQCPMWNLYALSAGGQDFLAPHVEINELSGLDRVVNFDVYASTQRVYLLLNGQPYGCVNLPADRLPAGQATVTFGDVLYHSGVDLSDYYKFHVDKMQVVTSRHYSNLSFSSGVAAPAWDENRLPCVAADGLL